jgi:hypothetical protein
MVSIIVFIAPSTSAATTWRHSCIIFAIVCSIVCSIVVAEIRLLTKTSSWKYGALIIRQVAHLPIVPLSCATDGNWLINTLTEVSDGGGIAEVKGSGNYGAVSNLPDY